MGRVKKQLINEMDISEKEIIKIEYQKCASDPIYFMKKYCMIQHPVRGKIPFHLYPFQERTLEQWEVA